MRAALGFLRLNTTVVSSGAVMVSTSVKKERASGDDRRKDQSCSRKRTLQHMSLPAGRGLDGQGPHASRHTSTADSAVGPPHADRFDRKQQAALGYSGSMALARRDKDRFTRTGHEWTCLELDAKLALRHRAFPTPRAERKPFSL